MKLANVHISTEQLNLQRDCSLCNPNGRENAAEDVGALCRLGSQGQEGREDQTEEKWTPEKHVSRS